MTTLIPDPYHARRRRKVRLISGIGISMLGLFGALALINWLAALAIPTARRTPENQYLSDLPYPDPAPDQSDLLIFTPSSDGTAVSTHWLPLTLAPPGPDGSPRPGTVYFRFETFIEGRARSRPTDHALLHLAATGEARLPLDPDASVHFNAERSITLTANRKMLADAADLHAPPPPLHDPMLYMIHPDAILDLINHPDTSPAITMTIGPHRGRLTETHLAPLRALAATLKPGYAPPPSP